MIEKNTEKNKLNDLFSEHFPDETTLDVLIRMQSLLRFTQSLDSKMLNYIPQPIHNNSSKQIIEKTNHLVQNQPKEVKIYNCEKCQLVTSNKKDYSKHLLTAKHLKKTERYIKIQKSPELTCECGKNYKHYSGLWRHKKTCNNEGKNEIVNLIKDNNDFKNIIIEVVKNNAELQKQNADFQKQVLELCKKSNTSNSNNTNNINSHNKTFNLQFFLNEQCKDAMNLTDFVDSMTLEFSDLEDVGKLGYVEGISKIMIRKLNEMDIYKRPIHCSDAKREIMYVKEHNVWEKEKNSNQHIRKAIKRVTHKNGGLLVPWSLENPNCMNLDHHLNDVYLRMMGQSMGGSGEFVDSENKIMKKIAKAVFIDKL